MVSFRFHLVSLIAVFLALALGIGMGVTVIDKATVDLLQRRLDSVQNAVQDANQRSDDLQGHLSRDGDYESRAEDYLINGQLKGVPVVTVGMRGIDQSPYGDVKHALGKAGATLRGTLWVTQKDVLDAQPAVAALAQDMGLPANTDVAQVRQSFLARVAAVFAGSLPSSSLRPLTDDGYLEWEPESGQDANVANVDLSTGRLLVLSAFNPTVPNDQLALPLTRLLAAEPARRVVAIEAGRDPDAKTSGERAVFLGSLRSDQNLRARMSSVDDIETSSGRVAAVLALAQLSVGRTGQYGIDSSATDGPIPKLSP